MFSASTNAVTLARRLIAQANRMDNALRRGITKIAAAIDKGQTENLRGSNAAAPGTYPVPARSGNLLQSHFFEVEKHNLAFVGNIAKHAIDVHEGLGGNRKHGRRAFLDDAVETVDPQELLAIEIRKEAAR